MAKDMMAQSVQTRTYTGLQVDITQPEPEMFSMTDLMFAQSQTTRALGGTRFFYSCAQSAVIGSHLAEMLYDLNRAKAYMFRFGPIYYMGFLHRDLICRFPELENMRDRIGQLVLEKVGVDREYWMDDAMMDINNQLLAIEMRDLKPNAIAPFNIPSPRSDVSINPMSSIESFVCMCNRMRELFGDEFGAQHEIEHWDASREQIIDRIRLNL